MKHSLIYIAAVMLLTACSASKKSNSFTETGFLDNYSQLKSSDDEHYLHYYQQPNVPWNTYRAVFIDPVQIVIVDKSSLSKIDMEKREDLAELFHSHLKQEVGKIIPIVDYYTPDTLRLQAALTNADKSEPLIDTVTSVFPTTIVLNALGEVAGSDPFFTGGAAMEIKIIDATSGAVLSTALDSRVGSKVPDVSFNGWNDTYRIIHYWAKVVAFKLCESRNIAICEKPKA